MKYLRKFGIYGAFILAMITISGCSTEQSAPIEQDPVINIGTTIFPLADVIRQLGGDKVKVFYLLPAGASAHTYEPTVAQARLVAESQLFVSVGAGLDNWAVGLAEASERQELILIDLSKYVDLMAAGHYYEFGDTGYEHQPVDSYDKDNAYDHAHGSADPHFWLDPVLVRDYICPRLFDALVLLAPEHKGYFAERLAAYQDELTALHEEIKTASATFTRHSFIAYHSAWQYFARRYGLHEIAVIANFPGQEPSAGWVADLVKLVREEEIGAIFAEPQFPPALAERIAEESGTRVLLIDPYGGEGLPGRGSYLELMRFNLEAFKKAME